MRVINVHQRRLTADQAAAGKLLDGLAGPEDRLWPRAKWPAMILDAPLGPGARGGHGPVRYHVSWREPGRRVRFDFDDAGLLAGFDGYHEFSLVPDQSGVLLRHVLDGTCGFRLWLKWLLVVRPLHDALLEDALDQAMIALGTQPRRPARWSLWVLLLRRIGKSRPRHRQ